MHKRILSILIFIWAICVYHHLEGGVEPEKTVKPPRVLCVMAHPDDEIACAGTLYHIIHHLHGTVDLVVITNGEGGFRYSLLAEPFYGFTLTAENIGRKYLPLIRKQETLDSAKILGIQDVYFLDQKDPGYTQDVKLAFSGAWDIPFIKNRLMAILTAQSYDYVFVLLPHPKAHGHHQAATVLALEAINALDTSKHPIILAIDTPKAENDEIIPFSELPDFPLTKMWQESPMFSFNKLEPIGFNGKLNLQIIVNWVIAAYKSQGALQLLVNKGKSENFYYFALNGEKGIDSTKALFEKLNE